MDNIKDRSYRVSAIKFSPDGEYLAVARVSELDMYSVKNWKYLGKCTGHSGVIIHIDWSEDSRVLQTDSNAYEHLYWSLEDLLQIKELSKVRDLSFYSWSCLLGWPVIGIWPPGCDGTDINTVHFNNKKTLIATGDDFNQVKIFRYPSYQPQAQFRSSRGHSSHVSRVMFTPDDQCLITAGSGDQTIILWQLSDSTTNLNTSVSPKKTLIESNITLTTSLPSDTPPTNPHIEKLNTFKSQLSDTIYTQLLQILTDTKKKSLKRILSEEPSDSQLQKLISLT